MGLGKLATGAGVAGLGVGLPLAQLGMFGQSAEDTVDRDSLIYDPDAVDGILSSDLSVFMHSDYEDPNGNDINIVINKYKTAKK